MNDYIFNLEKEIQPYLLDGYYTFIGPANPDKLGDFTSVVHLVAPARNVTRTINNALSNKTAVRQVLAMLYQDAELSVYVAESNATYGLIYSTIEDYCEKLALNFRLHSS